MEPRQSSVHCESHLAIRYSSFPYPILCVQWILMFTLSLAKLSLRCASEVASQTAGHCTSVGVGSCILLAEGGRSRHPASPYGCTIISINTKYIAVTYSMFLYSGIGFTNYRRIQDYPLLKVFYQDGILYFVALAVMAIVNALTAVRLPGINFSLDHSVDDSSQAAVHSILVTRMVLHLKQQAGLGMDHTTEPKGSGAQLELTALSTVP
ncbi:hypothetical protein BKA70DRAFT_1228233 [Coprinopsis sp. MPI-PUGE-AT-0042]|nr:hypothetical protein BKA70DRAFT_1228233 [Coprinopsis sp. MPI-PUGE-AT-0042]